MIDLYYWYLLRTTTARWQSAIRARLAKRHVVVRFRAYIWRAADYPTYITFCEAAGTPTLAPLHTGHCSPSCSCPCPMYKTLWSPPSSATSPMNELSHDSESSFAAPLEKTRAWDFMHGRCLSRNPEDSVAGSELSAASLRLRRNRARRSVDRLLYFGCVSVRRS